MRGPCPRRQIASWTPAPDRPSPIALLRQTNAGRLPGLLDERYRRMGTTPFAFFRGAAAVMAADLARQPNTGLTVQLCGDAHVRNLGAYAAPDGRLVFDLNDFDETARGPWEWDVKRLATSLVLAGTEAGHSASDGQAAVRTFVSAYRTHLRAFAQMPVASLDRYLITRHNREPLVADILAAARLATPERNLKRLTTATRAGIRFHDRKPTLQHVSAGDAAAVLRGLRDYRDTLHVGHRQVFDAYEPADVAFKVVGTGSVGTRDFIVLLFGNGGRDPLFLQVKQALPSCYTPYLPAGPSAVHQGQRVAEGQQMIQTVSDPFLGYTRFGGHDYLVRQLADHKASLDPSALAGTTLAAYSRLCGEVLAKGHARTGDGLAIAGYAGTSARLDNVLADFAVAYSEQVAADFARFVTWLRRRPRVSPSA